MKYTNRLLLFWTLSGRPSDKESRLRDSIALGPCLAFAFLLMQAPGAFAQQQHSLPLVKPAGSTQEGFLRIVNRSDHAGTVTIHAIDDDGDRFGDHSRHLDDDGDRKDCEGVPITTGGCR